jgi:PAS domain S-box-containing protein
MFEVGPIGIAIISARGVVMEANSSLRKIAGGDHDPVGRKLSDYCEPARAEELRQGLRAALQAGEESFSGEVVVRQSGGETRLVNFVASAVRAPAGELDYGLLMVRDIPERRRAEELLLESERFAAMGRMAARIAHEINNPLAGIKNAFRLIKPAVSPEHPYAHYVPRIDHEIDRVAGIVREMYELYRPSGEVQQECWIDEAITDVVALLRVAQPEGRIELDVCAARVRACLASGPLRQVLYNLIQNGLEHSPEGSPVRVSAVVEGDVLKLTVEDHGEGISPEDGARIFDSFFSTKEGRVNAGLGLGLAITHSAVEAMGGTVEFESELHVGTSFRVSIPLQVEGAENLPSPSELAALPS